MMKELRKYFYYVLSQVSLPGASGCDFGLSSRAPGSALMWSLLNGMLVLSRLSISSLLSLLVWPGGAIPPRVGCNPSQNGSTCQKHPSSDNDPSKDGIDNRAFSRVGDFHCKPICNDGCQLRGARSKLSKLDSLASRPMKPQSAAPSPLSKQERENVLANKLLQILHIIYLNLLLHHRYHCDGDVIIRDQFHAAVSSYPSLSWSSND